MKPSHLYIASNTFSLVHYFPVLSAFISRFGGFEGGATVAEARQLNDQLFDTNLNHWNLVYMHAAVRTWWLAEYASLYGENHDGSLSEVELDAGEFEISICKSLVLTWD